MIIFCMVLLISILCSYSVEFNRNLKATFISAREIQFKAIHTAYFAPVCAFSQVHVLRGAAVGRLVSR